MASASNETVLRTPVVAMLMVGGIAEASVTAAGSAMSFTLRGAAEAMYALPLAPSAPVVARFTAPVVAVPPLAAVGVPNVTFTGVALVPISDALTSIVPTCAVAPLAVAFPVLISPLPVTAPAAMIVTPPDALPVALAFDAPAMPVATVALTTISPALV